MTLSPPSDPLDARTDHYAGLQNATLVPTTATRTTHAYLRTVIKARSIMCVYGQVGLGKTVSVKATLRDVAPQHTVRLTSPKLSRIREELHRQMNLAGDPPRTAGTADATVRQALIERPWVVVCDEAQLLDSKVYEYYRELWDDDDTQMTLVFVGTDNCHAKIRARPALANRIMRWQQFSPLTPTEVATVIPSYHPLWTELSADDIQWTNDLSCHGNFRNWARMTYLLDEVRQENPGCTIDRKLIRWIAQGLH